MEVKCHGWRTSSNWRYKVIKGYKHRAQKFERESKTLEESEAWHKVVEWFDSVLRKRQLTPSGAIGIPKVEIDNVSVNVD